MAQKTYTSRSLRFAPVCLPLLLSIAVGCGDEASDLDDHMFVPPPINDGGLTTDSSTVVVGDSSTPVGTMGGGNFDAGGSLPFDAGGATPDAGGQPDTGVVNPDSGAPDSGAPDAGPARADQGMGDGKDVITIGDSWMNLDNSIGIQQSLEKVSKRDYRNYGVPGTKLLDEVIPNQYKKAKGEGPIKTVIMTGGGNDVLQDLALLFGPCDDTQFDTATGCKERIDQVAARLQKLWAEMATDGVQDVYIIGYSSKTSPLNLGIKTGKSIAYSSMKIDPICQMVPAPLRCTAMDTDKEVPGLTIGGDGIHPTAAGYDLLGAQVWKVMQEKGMRR